MLIATTTWRMPSSETMNEWRLVCVITPWRASIIKIAKSAVEAPVAMLRVYCLVTRRVGDDELAFRRAEIAVRDVNRDPLARVLLSARP